MKKVILLGLVVSAFTLGSCKKDGKCTCTVLGADIVTNHNNMDSDEYKETKDNCESVGCDWSATL